MALFVPSVITVIPDGAVDGLLTFVGVAGLLECQLWERLLLLFRSSAEFPVKVYTRAINPWRMHAYTLIQVFCLAVAWAVNLSPAGLAFSLVVVLLVPFRTHIVGLLSTGGVRRAGLSGGL